MKWVIVCIIVSAIVSCAVAKAVAVYHFKVIDSYVREIVDLAKRNIEEAYTKVDIH